MKKILCFGDSNTFGFNPIDGSRYIINNRWSGILKQELKDRYFVVEQGCNNRTAVCDNSSIETTGYKAIKNYLSDDLDIIILQLGINDMQYSYNCDLETFKNKFRDFVVSIKDVSKNAKIILLCPNKINDCILKSNFSLMFNETSIEKSKKLPEIYYSIAKEFNSEIIDLNLITKTSTIDGLHYDVENHIKIAKKLLDSIL